MFGVLHPVSNEGVAFQLPTALSYISVASTKSGESRLMSTKVKFSYANIVIYETSNWSFALRDRRGAIGFYPSNQCITNYTTWVQLSTPYNDTFWRDILYVRETQIIQSMCTNSVSLYPLLWMDGLNLITNICTFQHSRFRRLFFWLRTSIVHLRLF